MTPEEEQEIRDYCALGALPGYDPCQDLYCGPDCPHSKFYRDNAEKE